MSDEAPPTDCVLELTDEDFGTIRLLMGLLDSASGFKGLEELEIHATVNGEKVLVGWGESGNPALLVRPDDPPIRCECGWRGIGNHHHDARLGRADA